MDSRIRVEFKLLFLGQLGRQWRQVLTSTQTVVFLLLFLIIFLVDYLDLSRPNVGVKLDLGSSLGLCILELFQFLFVLRLVERCQNLLLKSLTLEFTRLDGSTRQ